MATNLVYRNPDAKNRARDLGRTVAPGSPAIVDGRAAVAVTGSADYTISETFPGVGTLSGIPAGGVGLEGQEVTLAFDGTWEFNNITGAVATSIAQDADIYITSGNALTTTSTGNTLWGNVDFPPDYDKTRGFVPVRIGA